MLFYAISHAELQFKLAISHKMSYVLKTSRLSSQKYDP